MKTGFDAALARLQARVQQVRLYHLVQPTDPGDDEIAHFTNWEACSLMFDTKARGISLWASDADCLNDSLEGKELLRFGQAAAAAAETPDAPPWVTGRYGRQAWERPAPADAGHEDLPHLAASKWRDLPGLLGRLFAPSVTSVASFSTRQEPVVGSGVYLVSFCRDIDRLDLWRAYTKDATGVCLAMPLAAAAHRVSPEWRFYRVAYDDRSKARAWAVIFDPLEAAIEAAGVRPPAERGLDKAEARRRHADRLARVRKALAPALYLFKNEQFRAEREIRLVYVADRAPLVEVRPGAGGTFVATAPFFLGVPGCRAVLGPRSPQPHHRASVLRTLHAKMTRGIPFSVERSGVSYV